MRKGEVLQSARLGWLVRRRIVVAAAIIAAGVATGCGFLGRQAFGQPKVTLKSVRLAGLGVTGGDLRVVLKVYNPNGYRLDATRLTYSVDVDSTPLANGVDERHFTVAQKDSQFVELPITVTFAGISAVGRSVLALRPVNYHVSGDIIVATPVGNFTVPYAQNGRFPADH